MRSGSGGDSEQRNNEFIYHKLIIRYFQTSEYLLIVLLRDFVIWIPGIILINHVRALFKSRDAPQPLPRAPAPPFRSGGELRESSWDNWRGQAIMQHNRPIAHKFLFERWSIPRHSRRSFLFRFLSSQRFPSLWWAKDFIASISGIEANILGFYFPLVPRLVCRYHRRAAHERIAKPTYSPWRPYTRNLIRRAPTTSSGARGRKRAREGRDLRVYHSTFTSTHKNETK